MRILSLLLLLTACSGDPRDYGITGARPVQPPAAREDLSGIPDSSGVIGPSVTPTTGGGRFWGYN